MRSSYLGTTCARSRPTCRHCISKPPVYIDMTSFFLCTICALTSLVIRFPTFTPSPLPPHSRRCGRGPVAAGDLARADLGGPRAQRPRADSLPPVDARRVPWNPLAFRSAARRAPRSRGAPHAPALPFPRSKGAGRGEVAGMCMGRPYCGREMCCRCRERRLSAWPDPDFDGRRVVLSEGRRVGQARLDVVPFKTMEAQTGAARARTRSKTWPYDACSSPPCAM
ncbi:hypothetical protein C8Q78DRAFT_534556 [Trametes maxima]|nr:hypothetical protein C8Q78DRAFT_534556 [Trametes maxima]